MLNDGLCASQACTPATQGKVHRDSAHVLCFNADVVDSSPRPSRATPTGMEQRTALEALVGAAPQQQQAVQDGPLHADAVQLLLQEVHMDLCRCIRSGCGHE